MPLVGFRPVKARLVIDQSKDTVLVMKVVASSDERLVLATGGSISSLQGVLRIREHKPHLDRRERKLSGTLVYVDDTGRRGEHAARYQINISMAGSKFASLLRIAVAGRLPSKVFIEAGERLGPFGSRGIQYISRPGGPIKVWNNRVHRKLPVSHFTLILPVDLAAGRAPGPQEFEAPLPSNALATGAQVAELADELLTFQAETHYTLKAIVAIIGVILLLAVVFNVVLLYR